MQEIFTCQNYFTETGDDPQLLAELAPLILQAMALIDYDGRPHILPSEEIYFAD